MQATNVGTELKMALTLECAGLSMKDYDFTATFFTFTNKRVAIPKSEMVYDDENDVYLAVVDTSALVSGEVKVRVEATITDPDCEGGYRTEIATIRTGIILKG